MEMFSVQTLSMTVLIVGVFIENFVDDFCQSSAIFDETKRDCLIPIWVDHDPFTENSKLSTLHIYTGWRYYKVIKLAVITCLVITYHIDNFLATFRCTIGILINSNRQCNLIS